MVSLLFSSLGQGTTFNSGGLCLRDCPDMIRADMASAAIIFGVIKAVAAMRLPVNVRGESECVRSFLLILTSLEKLFFQPFGSRVPESSESRSPVESLCVEAVLKQVPHSAFLPTKR